jgi:hypothetical protein
VENGASRKPKASRHRQEGRWSMDVRVMQSGSGFGVRDLGQTCSPRNKMTNDK